jgi:Protein of unknown function (DUF3500)
VAETSYRGFKARPELIPITRARVDRSKPSEYILQLNGTSPAPDVLASAAVPFTGITTDGHVVPGLFPLHDGSRSHGDLDLDPAPAVEAATALLAGLPAAQRSLAARPLPADAAAWRLWTNAYPSWEPDGVFLEDLDAPRREAVMELVRASLGAKGFLDVQTAMRLNAALGQLIDQYHDSLTEWAYWITLFGEPSATGPWGWQLFGHHVCVSCFMLGGQMVLTPTFLGAEFESQQVFAEHRAVGLELITALSPAQRDKAVLYGSMGDLPWELAGRVDGRHLGGAGQDNRIVPYAGLAAEAMTPGQQELLVRLVGSFVSRMPPGPAAAKLAEVRRHLADTYFAWIGAAALDRPCYFRVHSPVVLAEYDNHPGVFLDFDQPDPCHVHTVVRTPNGNDYGLALLRQHYALHHRTVGQETT